MSTIANPAPLQRRFGFETDLCPRRPLMTLGAVMAWLDKDEDAVTYLAEDGTLLAINIARAGARRRELRFWRDSILAAALRSSGHQVEVKHPISLGDEVIAHHRPTIKATEAKRLLNCSQALIAALLADAELRCTFKPGVKSGPSASPTISRESLVKFINQRIVL